MKRVISGVLAASVLSQSLVHASSPLDRIEGVGDQAIALAQERIKSVQNQLIAIDDELSKLELEIVEDKDRGWTVGSFSVGVGLVGMASAIAGMTNQASKHSPFGVIFFLAGIYGSTATLTASVLGTVSIGRTKRVVVNEEFKREARVTLAGLTDTIRNSENQEVRENAKRAKIALEELLSSIEEQAELQRRVMTGRTVGAFMQAAAAGAILALSMRPTPPHIPTGSIYRSLFAATVVATVLANMANLSDLDKDELLVQIKNARNVVRASIQEMGSE